MRCGKYRFVLTGACTLLPLLGSVSGCSENNALQRVPIEGHVFIDGEPLPGGIVRFVPERGRPTSGEVGTDGRFRVVSHSLDGSQQPGLVPGLYRVSVSSHENLDEDTSVSRIPGHFSDHRTSGIEIQIDEASDSLDIEMQSDTPGENGETEIAAEAKETDPPR